ncbi:MAG: phosphate ABC transporter substrate-binding protein [Planctomycetota bacterium]
MRTQRDLTLGIGITASLAVLVAVTGLLTAGCGRKETTKVNAIGSTSIQPFAELLADAYQKTSPGTQVEVQGGGSTAGIQALASGIADIGMCSRSLNAEEQPLYTAITIARDGLAVIVHPSNPAGALTLDQVRKLFSGETANWKELGGPDLAVRIILREEGSGTREAFTKLVMKDGRFSDHALVQESNGAVKELVKNDPAAVGYMSLGLVGADVKDLMIDGAKPVAAEVTSGKYPLARPFLFVVKGTPPPHVQAFIDFVLSPAGQALLVKEGLVGMP